ncbi:MAG: AAA family ATPase [Phycisphaerae bacterium]|nr:AAA family ATPase [Phycisphaerae bacterium]
MMYLTRIRLKNVRCFESLDLRLGASAQPTRLAVVVGDNATGKTALMRSIALGLCDESSAAGLMKESDEGYIRRGCQRATITLDLFSPTRRKEPLQIRTTIERIKPGRIAVDRVRQSTNPAKGAFPWHALFLAAYGAGRGVAGTGDVADYTPINAVYNLFNYTEGLQNPELMLRRHSNGAQIEKALTEFTRTKKVHRKKSGVLVDGPWGNDMPLRDLADGYRGAILWLTDLLGWAVAFNPKLHDLAQLRGIVLIDELEEHMHARWQRTVIDDLRHILPGVQFLVTTHSPLIASSVGLIKEEANLDKLFALELQECNRVTAFDHPHMNGWRMDQVLASRAFRYQIHADPQFRNGLRRASELLAKKTLTQAERRQLKRIRDRIEDSLFTSNSPVERDVELEMRQKRRREIRSLEHDLFGQDESQA